MQEPALQQRESGRGLDWGFLLAPGYASDYEMLYDLYITKDWSLEQIGDFLGVNKATVRLRCERLEIPIKPKGGSLRQRQLQVEKRKLNFQLRHKYH